MANVNILNATAELEQFKTELIRAYDKAYLTLDTDEDRELLHRWVISVWLRACDKYITGISR